VAAWRAWWTPSQKRSRTFRVAEDLAEKLERYVGDNPEWTKVEILSVALHWFLEAAQEQDRLDALVDFRSRRKADIRLTPEDEKKLGKRKK
jgi:hypothetical protein